MQYSDDADDSSEISPIQSNDSVKENLQFTYITSTPSQNTGLVRLRKQQLAAHVQANNHPTQLRNLFNQPVRQTTPPTPVATTATATTTTSRPIPSTFVPTPTTTKPKRLAEKQFLSLPWLQQRTATGRQFCSPSNVTCRYQLDPSPKQPICAAHGDEDAHVSLVDSQYSLDYVADHFTLDGARHHEHFYRFPSRFSSRPDPYFYVSSYEESWLENSLLSASDFSDEPSRSWTPISSDFNNEPPRSSTPISSEEASPAWPQLHLLQKKYTYNK